MIRVDEENDVALSDLLAQGISFLWQGRCIDNRGGDILGGPYARWDGDLRQNGLYLVRNEDIFDERGN